MTTGGILKQTHRARILAILGSIAAVLMSPADIVGPALGQAPAGQREAAFDRQAVSLLVAPDAAAAETTAIKDLADCLRRLYPRQQFEVRGDLPASGPAVLVGNIATDRRVRGYVKPEQLALPESFLVRVVQEGSRQMAIIAGADPRGTAYGVYALLEKLGCGFYLSYDALPPPGSEAFSLDGWELSDAPLVRDRVVFDWHNFLSGCSAWNLSDWQRWIVQARKMRFNGVMVHAYGNNPMVRFTFAGLEKPIGYLSTTQRGRDWSNSHVNDVRRLLGGAVFDEPVFGAAAGMVPDEQRGAAVETLMREVFQCAQDHGMDVVFAVDVDTPSSNPQELILKLPQSARFAVQDGSCWLANPETLEGYLYYQAQVQALVRAYPQITKLVLWFRIGGTPWMEMKLAEMPQAWQAEYRAAVEKTPAAGNFWKSHNLFALGKIATAFQRVLRELGREEMELCAGSWRFNFLPAADRFLPAKIKLYPLDYEVLSGRSQLGDGPSRQQIRDVAEHRGVVPVAWAHHDDGAYVGRPYTPFEGFSAKLAECRAAGFGIIHWTTRPLDLYFASLAQQVWRQSRDQPLRTTCEEMAARSFGLQARAVGGEYLARWVTEAPIFGRATRDQFILRKLEDIDQAVDGCRDRLKLLERVDVSRLSLEQRERLEYYRGLEAFCIDFFRAQDAFQRCQESARQGDFAAARQAIAACAAEEVVERFAHCASKGGITRGQQGLIVSLNLRWLSHIAAQRQSLGLEAICHNVAPTSHDPLAQSAGWITFHVDADRRIWQCWGEHELDVPVWTLSPREQIALPEGLRPSLAEICRSGLESARSLTISLGPLWTRPGKPGPLRPGRYRVRLLLLDPTSTAPGERVFEISALAARNSAAAPAPLQPDRVDVFQQTGRRRCVLERDYEVLLDRPGPISVTLTPIRGKAVLCGAVIEPLEVSL